MVRATFIGNTDGSSSFQELAGLSTDTKPTTGLFTGSVFREVDTGKLYYFDEESGDWIDPTATASSSDNMD